MKTDTNPTQTGTEEPSKRVLRFPMTTGREPIDLAEWPVVTLAHAPIRDRVVIENILGSDKKGEGIPQGWELALRNVKVGAPIAGDQDIYVALMAILHETDFRERVLRITRADICRVLEWAPNLKRYVRIQEALARFRNVTYKGKNIFKDPETGTRFGFIEFGFVDSFGFSDRPPKRKPGAKQPELPLSYVRLADEFLILCRHANLKLIDLDFYRSLSRPETRWLYRFLDKNLYKRSEYRIGLRKLRRKQGLLSTYDPRYIKRDHAPRLDELKAKGFLRDWRFEKASDPDDPWMVWVQKDVSFGLRRAVKRLPGIEPQEAPKRVPQKRTAPQNEASETTANLVRYFHEQFHGTKPETISTSEHAKAKELLSRTGGNEESARFAIDWTHTEASRTNFAMQHFAALLLNSYPERAMTDFDQHQAAKLRAEAREEQLNEYHAYQDWRTTRIEELWEALPESEQEAILVQVETELRKEHGAKLRYWQDDAVKRHVRARAKERSTANVPTFDEWKRRQATAPPTNIGA